jgi:hypothetical protein
MTRPKSRQDESDAFCCYNGPVCSRAGVFDPIQSTLPRLSIHMKRLYLPLAGIGLIVPYLLALPALFYYLGQPDGLSTFLAQPFATPLAACFAADVLITLVVLWVFVWREARRLGIKLWWPYIVASLLVGPAFALPLFLHFREQRRDVIRIKQRSHNER